MKRLLSACAAVATALFSLNAAAKPPATADMVRARNLVFGAEHVDQRTAQVDSGKVIFSWLTNATLAASVKGHVILLDTFVHRAEAVPGRTPFVVEDLVSLNPEMVFIGHGHGDHADNAAWLGGQLGIPLFASAETCADLKTLDLPALITAGTLPAGRPSTAQRVSSIGSFHARRGARPKPDSGRLSLSFSALQD